MNHFPLDQLKTVRYLSKHMNIIPRTLLPLVAAAALTQTSSAALIANWDFSTGTSADLTSSIGGYTFNVSPNGSAPVYSAGAISLGPTAGLFATGLNSTALPSLKQAVTLYVRIRMDTAPSVDPSFFYGLVNSSLATEWGGMALTAFNYNSHTSAFANTGTGDGGDLASTYPTTGQYFTMALVATAGVDANGNADPTKVRLQTYLNGTMTNFAIDGTSLINFQSFGLGKLKESSTGNSMTFDSVQIYDTALTASQIAAIPEPTTAIYVAVSLVALVGFRQRRKVAGIFARQS